MNRLRSELKAKEFLENKANLKEKTIITKKNFKAKQEDVFNQLCPTRELDWIDGWECDIVHTTTGYAQKDCIFTTPKTNIFGEGTWVFTEYIPNDKVELIIVNEATLQKMSIGVKKITNNLSEATWTVNIIALNNEGNNIIDSLGESIPALDKAINGLEYFLENGKLLEQEKDNEK